MGALDQIRLRQIAAGIAATEKHQDAVLAAAQAIVPLREGTLAGTADRETTVGPLGATVRASFSTVYAERQHEETGWTHLPGRQARYLEQPFKAAVPRLPLLVAAALRSEAR